MTAKALKYYYAHRAEILAKARRRRRVRPEKAAERSRAYRQAHPEKVAAANRKYRQEHPDKVAAYNRKYYLSRKAAARKAGVKRG